MGWYARGYKWSLIDGSVVDRVFFGIKVMFFHGMCDWYDMKGCRVVQFIRDRRASICVPKTSVKKAWK